MRACYKYFALLVAHSFLLSSPGHRHNDGTLSDSDRPSSVASDLIQTQASVGSLAGRPHQKGSPPQRSSPNRIAPPDPDDPLSSAGWQSPPTLEEAVQVVCPRRAPGGSLGPAGERQESREAGAACRVQRARNPEVHRPPEEPRRGAGAGPGRLSEEGEDGVPHQHQLLLALHFLRLAAALC